MKHQKWYDLVVDEFQGDHRAVYWAMVAVAAPDLLRLHTALVVGDAPGAHALWVEIKFKLLTRRPYRTGDANKRREAVETWRKVAYGSFASARDAQCAWFEIRDRFTAYDAASLPTDLQL